MFSKFGHGGGGKPSHVLGRFGVSGVISVIALVFAMSGAAFATKYVITSTKQIKPSVLSALKGQQGPQGLPGNPGPVGPQGPKGDTGAKGEAGAPGQKGATGPAGSAGAAGATGPTGSPGATGAIGATGPAGATGPTGTTGSPWTAGGTLPSGSTETGSWATIIPASLGALVGIQFTIPLAAALPESKVHIAPDASCPGTAEEPKAASGHLCVY